MKLEKVDQIWTEVELAKRFGLPINEITGRSRQISTLVQKGLKYVEMSSRRYFFETEIIEFFESMAESQSS